MLLGLLDPATNLRILLGELLVLHPELCPEPVVLLPKLERFLCRLVGRLIGDWLLFSRLFGRLWTCDKSVQG